MMWPLALSLGLRVNWTENHTWWAETAVSWALVCSCCSRDARHKFPLDPVDFKEPWGKYDRIMHECTFVHIHACFSLCKAESVPRRVKLPEFSPGNLQVPSSALVPTEHVAHRTCITSFHWTQWTLKNRGKSTTELCTNVHSCICLSRKHTFTLQSQVCT